MLICKPNQLFLVHAVSGCLPNKFYSDSVVKEAGLVCCVGLSTRVCSVDVLYLEEYLCQCLE